MIWQMLIDFCEQVDMKKEHNMNKLELFLLAATVILAIIARIQYEVIKNIIRPKISEKFLGK